ncbi:LPS export ABC transporter permease LptG [Ancylobacter mangrovi]|uniref:LPS export ABC transporter permease LptG n=1 Tax=Ancylobacter mangrovi TaxID=2972472 RepID=A0A9X2PFD9_9HYPH|nr:LPS export ABC transporter permease LptG [Ancylobacter mangrovi]MCS0493618.1 LPS export ABC transporter permease LptG [Ancylobacter mangrovi]MCS0501764.1 LPS export ABC transporter permease LptG [Ancylobacter mangrovi]
MIGRTLGLYFGRRFLGSVLGIFVGCAVLIMLIDFLEMSRRVGERDVDSLTLLLLIIYRAPFFTEQLLPFAVLFGAIGTFLTLSRRLELVVARAAGVSAWQFITPACIIAMLLGVVSTTVYNPVSAEFKERANRIEAEIFNRQTGLFSSTSAGFWIRQQSVDGQAIIQAAAKTDGGRQLSGVNVFLFGRDGKLEERIEARNATLEDSAWRLHDARVLTPGIGLQNYDTYMVATNLTPNQVQESLQSETVSFWDLPAAVDAATRVGFGAERYRLQYQSLLARPMLLLAMVLIAASLSLRVFRFGGIGQTILGGVAAGFLLYVSTKLAEDLGEVGIVHPVIAAWFPAVVGALMGILILLHREDG